MRKSLLMLTVLTCIAACRGDPAPEPLDQASETSHAFACGDGTAVSMRLVGPDTVELTVESSRYILQHERSASGARYSDGQVTFWNKGDEAMLDLDGERYTCTRR